MDQNLRKRWEVVVEKVNAEWTEDAGDKIALMMQGEEDDEDDEEEDGDAEDEDEEPAPPVSQNTRQARASTRAEKGKVNDKEGETATKRRSQTGKKAFDAKVHEMRGTRVSASSCMCGGPN